MGTARSTLKNSVRAFSGTRFHFRLTAAETAGAVSVMDVFMRKGSEPPRHVHSNEDETNIVHTGEIHYYIGDKVVQAKKGDVVFLPRMIPHHFKVVTPTASVTLVLTPGGFERFFEAATFPFEGDDVPPLSDRQLSRERHTKVAEHSGSFGVKFL